MTGLRSGCLRLPWPESRMEPCPVGLPWGTLEGPLLVDPGELAGVTGVSCRV